MAVVAADGVGETVVEAVGETVGERVGEIVGVKVWSGLVGAAVDVGVGVSPVGVVVGTALASQESRERSSMIIAVRQALDFLSTFRAIGVCLVGLLFQYVILISIYKIAQTF